MSARYFKSRKPFRFAAHPYELGTIIGLQKGYEDNHFLLKLYDIDPACFKNYYAFHLDYFLKQNPDHKQKEFFAHVWSIVDSRIRYFEMQNPFSWRHARYISNLSTLRAFQEFLIKYDQWNMRPSDALVLHKDALISSLQQKLEKYEKRVAELEKYEVSLKVMIQQDHLGTVVDLLHQIKALEIPGTHRKLLKSDHDSPYYKLLARYFSHAGKDISIDTARNYFVKKPLSDAVKGSKVASDKKLFRITQRNSSSKA